MIVETDLEARLCTGQVRYAEGDFVVVMLEGVEVAARVAVALYRPAPGDDVLVACQADRSFVIGVLRIAGAAVLLAPGDFTVRSTGVMDLVSARQARLAAPRLSLEASTLQVVARSVAERFEKARRWVRDSFQVRAGRLRTDVDGTCETQAGRIVQCADGQVKIDGESIDLG
jgi:Protein of unknown function (DUF3540)